MVGAAQPGIHRSHAARESFAAGEHVRHGRGVVAVLVMEGTDDCHLVRMACQPRERAAKLDAGHIRLHRPRQAAIRGWSIHIRIERFDVAGPASQEEHDHGLVSHKTPRGIRTRRNQARAEQAPKSASTELQQLPPGNTFPTSRTTVGEN